jgi:hypothetical protein
LKVLFGHVNPAGPVNTVAFGDLSRIAVTVELDVVTELASAASIHNLHPVTDIGSKLDILLDDDAGAGILVP